MYSEKFSQLSDNDSLLADVIDMKNSVAWKEGTISGQHTDDTKLKLNAEPQCSWPIHFRRMVIIREFVKVTVNGLEGMTNC